MDKYYGKYRGQVIDNNDPMQLGRIKVNVPPVLGEGRMSWAMPCVPYGGPGVGIFAIPPVGANVWVEFEGGDTDHPIWSGCFWVRGEVPATPPVEDLKVLKTGSATITLDDTQGSGELRIEIGPPAVPYPLRLTMNSDGIELGDGQQTVRLLSTDVHINEGTL